MPHKLDISDAIDEMLVWMFSIFSLFYMLKYC